MNFEKAVSKLLTNKYVLYFVTFLAIMNIIGYLISGKNQAVLIFILVGCIMTYFSKNMIVILLTPLVFTALIVSGIKREGFKLAQPKPSGGANKLATEETKMAMDRTFDIGSGEESYEGGDADNSAGGEEVVEDSGDYGGDEGGDEGGDMSEGGPVDESFEVGRKKGSSRVDYGSTLEAAYEDLNKALGSDGIKRLTSDTQRLMKQQLELADAMKGMTPMLKQAQDMLKSLNITELGDITNMVKQIGGSSILKN